MNKRGYYINWSTLTGHYSCAVIRSSDTHSAVPMPLNHAFAYVAHGALVTLTCAPAVPRGPVGRTESKLDTRSCGSSGLVFGPALLVSVVLSLSAIREYGMPAPAGPGIRVACDQGAAVAAG